MLRKFMRRVYQLPVSGTGPMNRIAYGALLQPAACVQKFREAMITDNIRRARTAPAYREIYKHVPPTVHRDLLPSINKMSFHIRHPEVIDRLSDDIDLKTFRGLKPYKTSGSTTGYPSIVPLGEWDITMLRNYYINLGKFSGGAIPSDYWYLNMFPISNSSTGTISEEMAPAHARLKRSDANVLQTIKTITDSMDSIRDKPLMLTGIPILHLDLIDHLVKTKNTLILGFIKKKGICLYGGESPTLHEKLQLYKYFHQVISVYGSTEMGPRMGFSTDMNTIIDIALSDPLLLKQFDPTSAKPHCTFMYDKYLNEYEIENGLLVNNPPFQLTELKIKWNQEDLAKLALPKDMISLLKANKEYLTEKIAKIDEKYGIALTPIFEKTLDPNGPYKNLIKYFGLMIFYGRAGILYGAANLDHAFVASIHEDERSQQIKFKPQKSITSPST